MNKVTTINLHGKAYQMEERGFDELRAYLDEAARKLAGNPDKQEIMDDLEQAISEKADTRLNFHKTVLSESEVKDIIKEMGPVTYEEMGHDDVKQTNEGVHTTKRFYRIREGAIFGGVCTGIAAYWNLDVKVVRIVLIVLTLLTHGLIPIAYILTMVFVPYADTDEKRAAAYGVPFNAQELMNRVHDEFGTAKQTYRSWRRDRRRQWRENRRRERFDSQCAPGTRNFAFGNGFFFRFIFGIIAVILSILWIIGIITLLSTGTLYGWALAGAPVWITIIVFTIIYRIIAQPFRMYRYGHYGCPVHAHCPPPYYRYGIFGGFASLIIVLFGVYLIYQLVPQSHEVFLQIHASGQQAVDAVRQAFHQ
jgi:phage shock protein PspC (stress-responsive transcriptional regulator)